MFVTRPEITSKYIRIPVRRRKPGDRIRTITISASKGIKALYAGNRKAILTYLFLRTKGWTMSKAKKWVKEHSKNKFMKIKKTSQKENKARFSFAMPILKCYEEIKKDKEGNEVKKRFIEGIASSTDVDLHGDKMTPNAIKSMANSIKQHRIELNAEHDKSWQSDLGGVEKLSINKKNQLVMKAKLDITSKANDLWYALTTKKKELGLSIGGFVKDYKLLWDSKKERFSRVFKDIELDHIAVTSTPANPRTWVGAIAKSIDKVERQSEYKNLDKMSKDKLIEFIKKTLSLALGEDNLKKLLTNFSLNINEKTLMSIKKQKSSLESDEAKKSSAEAKDEEAKDASELEDKEEDEEQNSETPDNEDDDNADESKDDDSEDEDSDEDENSSDEDEDEESDDEDSDDKKDDEESDEEDSKGTDSSDDEEDTDEKSKDDSESDEEEEKSLTREEVTTMVTKGVAEGIKTFFGNLLGKKDKTKKDNDDKDTEAKKSKVNISFDDKAVKMLKSIVERQEKIETMLKKKSVNRKTVKSVAIDKDEEEVGKSDDNVFKTMDEELEAVKKQYANDSERAFSECGKVRQKWANKE